MKQKNLEAEIDIVVNILRKNAFRIFTTIHRCAYISLSASGLANKGMHTTLCNICDSKAAFRKFSEEVSPGNF